MFRVVAKIPISRTFNELEGVGFSDVGYLGDFRHWQDTFPTLSEIVFIETKRKMEKRPAK